MDIVRPVDDADPIYVMILRFDTYQQYTAWHESAERALVVKQSADMTVGEPVLEEAHGLEGWFTPPTVSSRQKRPARYKMTIVTIVGLYPLIVLIGALVAAVTGLPGALATLVTVIVVAAVATYWVMPSITKLLREWLFPQP